MNVFEEVKARVSIFQVVQASGIKVNRKGQFVCPFHNDKHPSASIKNDFFNCFVCGSGGDCISYTAKMYGLSNLDACKKINEDFNLGLSFGQSELHTTNTTERLRIRRERTKRILRIKEEKELEELVKHTGDVLANAHRILWQGLTYPYEDIRHQRALANLPQITYKLDCYDRDPVAYSKFARKEVEKLERIISVLYDERK